MRLIAVIILFLFSMNAAVGSETQKQVALKQNRLLNIEFKQEALLNDLIKINKKLKSQTIKIGQIQKEIEIINAEIERQNQGIRDASKLLVESKKRLTTKIKAISKIKSGNLLQVALVHNSLSDIEKSVKLMGIIASYDVQFINDYYEKKLALGREIQILASRNAALKAKESHMAEQKELLENDSRARLAWLEQVKQTRLFTESEIVKIKKTNKNNHSFEDLGVFDVFSKDSIVKNKGLLNAPLSGKLLQSYGIKTSDESVIMNHSGVFVAASSSKNVKALFNAEVIYQGILDGLGRVIVLDHGDNYYSVYGNLNEVSVKTKQIVKTGQVIAQSDYSPLFEGDGLYFEIRHYSQSLNPSDWIRSFHENN